MQQVILLNVGAKQLEEIMLFLKKLKVSIMLVIQLLKYMKMEVSISQNILIQAVWFQLEQLLHNFYTK